jgi:hypothetical protein
LRREWVLYGLRFACQGRISRFFRRRAGIAWVGLIKLRVRMMKSLALYGVLPAKTAVSDETGMPNNDGTRQPAGLSVRLGVLF